MSRKRMLFGAIVLVSVVACGPAQERAATDSRVLMATTTSTANTGLLDSLLPAFEAETGVRVDFIAVGTGAALELGKNGDVDLVMVHAPRQEDEFVRNGYGESRIPLMHNDFVILGPPSDPAEVAGSDSAAEAFRRIAEGAAPFISRGDRSGTHVKEQEIWNGAGLVPRGPWYVEAGRGMGACLLMASEKRAYTLSDRGTYLAYGEKPEIDVLFEGDPILVNPYAVIAVKPERRPGGNYEGTAKLIAWLVSSDGQKQIAEFRVNGHALFHPDAAGHGGP